MGNKLVLFGGGGHCVSVLDSILRTGSYSKIVILDAGIPAGTKIMGCEVMGDDSLMEGLRQQGFDNAFITIAGMKSVDARRKIYENAKRLGYCFVNITDPSAVISETAKLGEGVYAGKNAVINALAIVGDMAIINNGAIIEHECRIGDFTHVAPGAVICGGCRIGNDCFIGANATVIQEISITDCSLVRAGETVTKDVL
ncbi:MAG: NeuD/PglB/VioB family sugar acetyltransferase [Lachnospiraceae bacterium]|nr:NeuD/PglB/VioB family sugar acetyltransferase [Lachnospiraceae bacterium]